MTIFSDNPHDRRMERLMMTVPNFAPRGVGVRFSESQVFITATAATPTEILTTTMRQIRCSPFRKRFNEYIESEEKPMTYLNEKHRARFTLVAKNVHRELRIAFGAVWATMSQVRRRTREYPTSSLYRASSTKSSFPISKIGTRTGWQPEAMLRTSVRSFLHPRKKARKMKYAKHCSFNHRCRSYVCRPRCDNADRSYLQSQ